MTSEIRANTLKNRVGLGTISFTNTGPVVSGIVTANTFRLPDATSGSLGRLQIGNSLDLSLFHDGTNSHIVNNKGYLTIQSQSGVNGIFIARNAEVNLYYGAGVRLQTSSAGVTINKDLDVDGHTNLDNVSVSGITTFSGIVDAVNTPASIRVAQDIQHKGDADTKITFPAADTIALETGGSERLRITSAGHIGFNRSNVDINDTSSQQAVVEPSRFVFNNNYSNNYTDASLKLYLFMYGATRQGFTSGPNYDLQYHSSGHATHAKHSFFTQNTERLRINADGRVFIGETSVLGSAKLVVGNGGAENFEFTPGSSTYNGGLLEYIHRGDGNTRPDMNMYIAGAGAFKVYTSGANERLRIDSNGLMGLGITPTSHNNTTAFHIHDDYNSQGYPRLRLTNQASGSTTGDGYEIMLNGNDKHAVHRLREAADIYFMTNNVERLRIDSSGRVQVSGTLGYGNLPFGGNPANAAIQIRCNSKYNGIAFGENAVSGCIGMGGADTSTAMIFVANAHPANLGGGVKDVFEWHSGTAGGGGPGKYMTLDTSGDLTLEDGDLVIGTSGHGIDFSADSNAGGMSSQLLDDYEEGSWTPSLPSGGSATLVGRYTKIGNTVLWQLTVNSISGAASFKVSGLPFAVNNSWGGGISISNYAGSAPVLVFAHSGASDIYFRNTSNVTFNVNQFTGKFFYVHGFYYVNA